MWDEPTIASGPAERASEAAAKAASSVDFSFFTVAFVTRFGASTDLKSSRPESAIHVSFTASFWRGVMR